MGKHKGHKGNKGSSYKGNKDKTILGPSIKKTKTKAVASNLKKLNLQNKAKTEKADEAFKAVRDAVVGSAKASKSSVPAKTRQNPDKSSAPVDMEAATDEFAKL